MLIIIEGPDGAGKSTLCDAITTYIERYLPEANRVRRLHAGPPRRHPVIEYEVPLWRYRGGEGRHYVIDRWHVGELIYPDVLGRSSELTPSCFTHIELFLRSRGALLVYVTADEDVLRRRLEERGDELVTIDQALQARELYIERLFTSMLPVELVRGDDGISPEKVAHIVGLARVLEAQTHEIRRFTTYVGAPQPKLLLLGESRGVNGKFTTGPGPAFVPYRATSGHYLLSALNSLVDRPTDLFEIGLANACDVDDVEGLWHALWRPEIVALGRKAEAVVKTNGFTYRTAPHPQWVRRFHHNRQLEYAELVMNGGSISWN